ncbi:MAG TPA: hypothetical protein VLN74_12510, partial [Ilumatobacteraceae bacterium]|nr:hypothetical protein [Ilumatobacteraceae bacterium]
MTVVEDPIVAEAPDDSADGRVFGDEFLWYPADPARSFDPVTDIAIGDLAPGVDWIAAVVEHCTQGLALLESIDP